MIAFLTPALLVFISSVVVLQEFRLYLGRLLTSVSSCYLSRSRVRGLSKFSSFFYGAVRESSDINDIVRFIITSCGVHIFNLAAICLGVVYAYCLSFRYFLWNNSRLIRH